LKVIFYDKNNEKQNPTHLEYVGFLVLNILNLVSIQD
jgi:hypothetical protein